MKYPPGPLALPAGVGYHDPPVAIRQRHQVERLALEQQGGIGPRRAPGMLAQPIVPAAGGVSQQQLEPVVRKQRVERVTQCLRQSLRRRRPGGDLRHQIEQRRHPLELEHLGAVRGVPLPSEPSEGGGQPLRHVMQQAERGIVVPPLAQIGDQQEADIATAEAHRHACGRRVSGVADDFLDQPELRRLELGRGQRDGEVVLGQRLGTKQHRASLPRVQPEPEEVVRQVGAQGVGKGLVPGGQGDAVAEHLVDPKDGNERSGMGRLHKRPGEGRRCAGWVCERSRCAEVRYP